MTKHGRVTADPTQAARGSMLGVCLNGGDPSALADVASMGFRWVRADCRWDAFEPTQGTYRFTSGGAILQVGMNIDDFLAALIPLGLRCLLTFYETPSWARSSARPNGGPSTSKRPPDSMGDYGNALRQFLARYTSTGARPDLRPALGAIELWNEPNWYQFWKSAKPGFDNLGPDGNWGSPNVSEYRDLVNSAILGKILAGSDVPLITGGVAGNVINTNYSYVSEDFVRRLFVPSSQPGEQDAVGGTTLPPPDTSLANAINPASVQGVGFHPYGYPCPPLTGNSFGPRGGLMYAQHSLDIILNEAGQRNLPLWNTEQGFPTRDQGANNTGQCTRATNLAGYSLNLEDLNDAANNIDQQYDTWFGLGTIPATTQKQFVARYGKGAIGPCFWFCYRNMGSTWSSDDQNFGIYYDSSRFSGTAKTQIKNKLIQQAQKRLYT